MKQVEGDMRGEANSLRCPIHVYTCAQERRGFGGEKIIPCEGQRWGDGMFSNAAAGSFQVPSFPRWVYWFWKKRAVMLLLLFLFYHLFLVIISFSRIFLCCWLSEYISSEKRLSHDVFEHDGLIWTGGLFLLWKIFSSENFKDLFIFFIFKSMINFWNHIVNPNPNRLLKI